MDLTVIGISIIAIQIILICSSIVLYWTIIRGVRGIRHSLSGIIHFMSLYNSTSIKEINENLMDLKKILVEKFEMELIYKNGRTFWKIREKDCTKEIKG